MKKTILVFGADGMLGSDIAKILSQDYQVIPKTINDIDITEKKSLEKMMKYVKPNIVINCAAYTDVDGAQTNREKAFLVNADAVKYIAELCKTVNAKLIHYSTDYVFDGTKSTPYTEEDRPNPINVYGESKLKGEEYIKNTLDNYLIIRTSWLFGKNGKNFVTTILRLANERPEIKVVDDQIGSPTYTVNLAQATEGLISLGAKGIFNVTNSGVCSWYEFAIKILEFADISNVTVMPIGSQELTRPAKRPKNSTLDKGKFFNLTYVELIHWKEALDSYLYEACSIGTIPR